MSNPDKKYTIDDTEVDIISPSEQKARQETDHLDILAHVLDSAFVIPGTNIRFGLDAVIGLIPVIGDTIGAAISLFLLHEARRLKLPWWRRWLMMKNIFIDWLFGLIPFFGDLFDVAFKSNTKNVRILREWREKTRREGRE